MPVTVGGIVDAVAVAFGCCDDGRLFLVAPLLCWCTVGGFGGREELAEGFFLA
jgi:hypothetical protein